MDIRRHILILRLWTAMLAGSAAAAVIAVLSFLRPESDHWLLKATAVWFGGGLVGLLAAARGQQRRHAFAGYMIALALNAAALAILYLQSRAYEPSVPEFLWPLLELSLRVDHYPAPSVRALSALVYFIAPHVAAIVALAWAKKTLGLRLLFASLLLVALAWSAWSMPATAFGMPNRGTYFCATRTGCETNYCRRDCYGMTPNDETEYVGCDNQQRVAHCECRHSRCRASFDGAKE